MHQQQQQQQQQPRHAAIICIQILELNSFGQTLLCSALPVPASPRPEEPPARVTHSTANRPDHPQTTASRPAVALVCGQAGPAAPRHRKTGETTGLPPRLSHAGALSETAAETLSLVSRRRVCGIQAPATPAPVPPAAPREPHSQPPGAAQGPRPGASRPGGIPIRVSLALRTREPTDQDMPHEGMCSLLSRTCHSVRIVQRGPRRARGACPLNRCRVTAARRRPT